MRLGVRGFTWPLGSTRMTPAPVTMNMATWFTQRKPYTSGAKRTSSASDSVGMVVPSVVDPGLREAGVALTLARHLRPACEQAGTGEQEPVSQVGRVVGVLLEAGVGDLLIVRIVLEPAGGDGHHLLVGVAIGARR